MSIQLFLSNCSLDLFYLLALFCMFFLFCLVVSNVVMFPQDMYKYRAFHVPTCSLFSEFFLRPKKCVRSQTFFAANFERLKFGNHARRWSLSDLRVKKVFFSCLPSFIMFFSCDNTRYRCVWRCDISVSVVAVQFCSKLLIFGSTFGGVLHSLDNIC